MNLKKILLTTSTVALVSGAAMAADDGLVVFDWSGYEDEGFFQNYITKHGDYFRHHHFNLTLCGLRSS